MNVLHQGKFLNLIDDNGWEYVVRNNCRTVVVIVPLLDNDKTIFVEQYRKPVQSSMIEFPAGLVGDGDDFDEDIKLAAARELEEETGYLPAELYKVAEGPASAGLSDESLEVYVARNLTKTGEGGGVEGENITVHVVKLSEVKNWLAAQEEAGKVVDLKVWGGLYFLQDAVQG